MLVMELMPVRSSAVAVAVVSPPVLLLLMVWDDVAEGRVVHLRATGGKVRLLLLLLLLQLLLLLLLLRHGRREQSTTLHLFTSVGASGGQGRG